MYFGVISRICFVGITLGQRKKKEGQKSVTVTTLVVVVVVVVVIGPVPVARPSVELGLVPA